MAVAALAGRRVDPPNAARSKFPLPAVGAVRERIRTAFVQERICALVCSAACGADLLALDVAVEMGIECRVILPFETGRFRQMSVVDRPGPWGELFDHLISAVQKSGGLTVLSEQPDPFVRTNREILTAAVTWSEAIHDGPPAGVVAFAVWNGTSRGPDDMTADFIAAAGAAQVPVRQISTLP